MFDFDRIRLTPEMLEKLHAEERQRAADARRRRLDAEPPCVLCDKRTDGPRTLHCTACGDAFKFCRACVEIPAGDVFCPWCADACEKALEE